MQIRKVRIHRFGGPEVLQVDSVEPSLPDASQVLVRVIAASINPVDFKIRNGQYPAVKEDRLPYTLGRDVSGIIEKCGAQAVKFKVGDEVFGMVGIGGGGYAEKSQSSINRRSPAKPPVARPPSMPLAFRRRTNRLARFISAWPAKERTVGVDPWWFGRRRSFRHPICKGEGHCAFF